VVEQTVELPWALESPLGRRAKGRIQTGVPADRREEDALKRRRQGAGAEDQT
jgi:hypothetical protein